MVVLDETVLLRSMHSRAYVASDPYCKRDCNALGFIENLQCQAHKFSLGCGGGSTIGNVLSKSPDPTARKESIFQQVVAPATLPENKNAICAKDCDIFDVFCKGAKVQAGCGGGSCGPIPVDCGFVALIGGGLVGVILLIKLMRR